MQVRTAIKKLKSTGEITCKSTNRNTVFTVVKYDLYQSDNKQNNIQITDKQHTDNRQITTTKERKEGKKEKDINNIKSGKPDHADIIREIINYLNKKTGKKFSPFAVNTVKHINARLNEGHSLDDFIAVIDVKTASWKGDRNMDKYLRPDTLFGTKFESYLNERPVGPGNMDCDRDYDFDELEKKLLKKQLGDEYRE